MTLLFSMVWQSVGDQIDFANLERDGVRYIQQLGPLEIALTNTQSAVVSGRPLPRQELIRAVDNVAAVDRELGGRLHTEDRWTGLRTKIESLPGSGAGATVMDAYAGAHDLLLALMDKVRNNSKLIRDPDADSYYLGDGATQELPEGIIAAANYTDLLVSAAGLPGGDRADALVDINSARSDLVGNARDLSEDVRLAVEGATGSRSLGSALLSKLDRLNRSIDNLVPLMQPVLAGKGRVDVAQIARARDEMQAAAADFSAALLVQIDIALKDRLSSLGQRRLLAIGTLALAVLLALVPLVMALVTRRGDAKGRSEPNRPPAPRVPAHQAPAHQAPDRPAPERQHPERPAAPPRQRPAEPVPAHWPPSRQPDRSDPEFARWERFGAPQ
ncbi:hypothetical protein [Actinoplanes sp. NBRC 103695]|uniref:hypothetical protein n=1 Tax=Actinoplanes sp. NBRC 103695 TaxID=3032202 RepID=UPI0025539FC1|nr:hypothetical protein [Actinoplanes sp. NBRC 103695]